MSTIIKPTKLTFKKAEAEWYNYHNTLKEIASGRYNDEIIELMNKKFETEYTEEQIRNAKARKRIRSNVPRRRPDPDAGLFTREQKEFIITGGIQ